MESNQSLEAVYYPHAIPQSRAALTVLALVYDKIHFPGVHLPERGVGKEEAEAAIKRLEGSKDNSFYPDPGWRYLPQYLRLMPSREYLEEFCHFPDASARDGRSAVRFQDSTKEIISGFAQAVGINIPQLTWTVQTVEQELHGGVWIGAPGWPSYSANAFVYAADNNIPLVSDDMSFPFPTAGVVSPEDRARQIATSLALQSVNMMLPDTVALTPKEIAVFRRETKDLVRPFRDSLLILAADVAALVQDKSDPEEIHREAKFIAETKVIPRVRELRRSLNEPGKPWYQRVAEGVREVPTFAAAICFMPPKFAAGLLAARLTAEVAAFGAEEMMGKMDKAKANPAYYLLRISEDIA